MIAVHAAGMKAVVCDPAELPATFRIDYVRSGCYTE